MRYKGSKAIGMMIIASVLSLCLTALSGGMTMNAETAQASNNTPKLIAHFSTYYGESSENRKHNVELAARKISGTILVPI